ncbi:MAG: peptide/nickel transport system permease protein [Caldanaerobacter sp.]|jgi:peptide/nickel transport system permease protein|nr:MAG: Binding-protein-dependent transport systems inner membrane component [bacterium 42_11]MDK2794478.1 peptide/nickel transport system permease protein [Caldanaerobacter sp.]
MKKAYVDRNLIAGSIIIAFIIFLAVFQPWLNKLIIGGHNPMTASFFGRYEPPSLKHLLGTDYVCRDVLALLLLGLKSSLLVGVVAGTLSTLMGIIVGFIAGYKGGIVDSILIGTTDTFLVIPSFPILLTLSAYVKKLDVFSMGVILMIFSWPFSARVIRSRVMSFKNAGYIELAKLNNMSDLEIIFLEILPNIVPFLGVGFGQSVVASMLAATGLEVIGLGLSGVITLGTMINNAIGTGALSMGQWNIVFPPIIVLMMVFIGVQLINMGLESTFNPRLRR